MKNLIRVMTLAALAAFALPAFAQEAAPAPADPCQEAARVEMYTKYYELKGKKNAQGQPDAAAQKEAYTLGKEYLAKYPSCNDTYSKAVQKFIGQYDEVVRKMDFPKILYGEGAEAKGRDFARGFAIGKEILADNANDLNTLMHLGLAGYTAQSLNPPVTTFNADGLEYVKRALQLIESGNNPTSWAPFDSKDAALGFLNFYAAEYMYFNKDLKGALPYYLKAANFAPTKDIALTYGRLAWAYQVSQYAPLQEEFTAKYRDKEETEESKHALSNLNQVMDRVMDAYARAIRLSGNDPKFQQPKAEWMQKLTDFYKFRNNNSTTGLDAYIASTATKPLPEPFTPQPFVPSAAPSTGGGTASDSGNTESAPAVTGTNGTTATAQPAAPSTTAAKPKPATKKP